MPNRFVREFAREVISQYEKNKSFFSSRSQAMKDLICEVNADAKALIDGRDYMIDITCFRSDAGSRATFEAICSVLSSLGLERAYRYDYFFEHLKQFSLSYVLDQKAPFSLLFACVIYSDTQTVHKRMLSSLCFHLYKIKASLESMDRAALDGVIEASVIYLQCIKGVLGWADDVGFLSGLKTYSNFFLIASAGAYAEHIASALKMAGALSLLSGGHTQANFASIVRAGAYVKDIKTALNTMRTLNNSFGGLTKAQAQSRFDAIVAQGTHAKYVANALEQALAFGLFEIQKEYAWENFDAIVSAGLHLNDDVSIFNFLIALSVRRLDFSIRTQAQAYLDAAVALNVHVKAAAYVLNLAFRYGLLSGDHAQVNFNAIVTAGADVEHIANAFEERGVFSLFDGAQAQANFNAIVMAGAHAKDVSRVLIRMHNGGALSGDKAQANRDAILRLKQYCHEIIAFFYMQITFDQPFFELMISHLSQSQTSSSEQRIQLYQSVSYDIPVITIKNIEAIFKLNELQIESLVEIMRSFTLSLFRLVLTADWFDFMLGVVKKSTAVEVVTACKKIIASQPQLKDFTKENFLKIPLLAHLRLEDLTADHLELYVYGYFSNITTLIGLLQLSAQEARMLLLRVESLKKPDVVVRFDVSHAGIIDRILFERLNLKRLLSLASPLSSSPLSADQDRFVREARERMTMLQTEFGIEAINDAALKEIEKEIREFLLVRIKEALVSDLAGAQEEKRQNLLEKIDFIDSNLEVLARRSDLTLVAKAVSYFSDHSDTAQTAWRAYEPTAPVVKSGWPNLFTGPSVESAKGIVFSTGASSDAALTLKTASDNVRRYGAVCYLASQKYPQMKEDFVYALAEIRRANTGGSAAQDNPSCYPGTLSRFLTATSKHPQFSDKKSPEDLKTIVKKRIKSCAQLVLNKMSETVKSGFDARLLLCAINLFSDKSKSEILSDKRNAELLLFATSDDLNKIAPGESEQEQIDAWIIAAKTVANQFLDGLVGHDGGSLYNDIVSALLANGIEHKVDEINYWVAQSLAKIGEGMSWPKVLMDAMNDDDAQETPEEVDDPKTLFKYALLDELPVDSSSADAAEELSERLNGLIQTLTSVQTRGSSPDFFKPGKPVLLDRDIKDKIKDLPEGVEITLQQVVSALTKLPGVDLTLLERTGISLDEQLPECAAVYCGA